MEPVTSSVVMAIAWLRSTLSNVTVASAAAYIFNIVKEDSLRIGLELILVIFALQYLLAKKYKVDSGRIKLNKKQVDELIMEWQPEPLVPRSLNGAKVFETEEQLSSVPIVASAPAARMKLSNMHSKTDTVLNMVAFDFLGFLDDHEVKVKTVEALRTYGVGTCGPPGFYGTMDVHQDLEKELAGFLGTEEAIIYAQGFSAVSSTIPTFLKRGDIIVVDDGVNFAIQKGCQISRSHVRFFKHNDMDDLERVMSEIVNMHKKPLTRRFVIVEGIYQNSGDIAPLHTIVALKERYKFRILIDESCAFGVLGARGRGTAEHFNVPIEKMDIIVATMSNSLCSAGGFCAGSSVVVDHQRLSSSAYCFSAALPAMLAVAALHVLRLLSRSPDGLSTRIQQLHNNVRTFQRHFDGISDIIESSWESAVPADRKQRQTQVSPVLHLRLRRELVEGVLRDDEERVLQEIVDYARVEGVLVTRSKYIELQEQHLPRPSIRVNVSAAFTKKEMEFAGNVLKRACVHLINGE